MSYYESNPKCPPFLNEIKPIYAQQGTKEYADWVAKQEPKQITKDGKYWGIMASTTYDLMTGKHLGTRIGEEPDKEAIENNKKVKECLKEKPN